MTNNGVTIHDDSRLPETGFIGGLSAGFRNSTNLLSQVFGEVIPTLGNKVNNDYIQTKGITATAGELFNPANIAMGIFGGEALGAVGTLTGEALSAATGITSDLARQVLGQTAATAIPRVAAGGIEGMGWTLLDHYEKTAGRLNEQISNASLAGGAVVGGLIGGVGGAVIDRLNPTEAAIGSALANDIDTRLQTISAANDKQYNPQNKMGYDLSFEQPKPLSEQTKQTDKSIEQANEPSPDLSSNQTLAPENKSIPAIRPETIDKLKLDPAGEIFNSEMLNILRAQAVDDNGIDLKSIPARIVYARNEFDARYSQILADADKDVIAHFFDPANDMNIRQALFGETDNLSDLDIKAGQLYNDLDYKLISEAQNKGIDIGYIDGYIRQVHDADRMRLVNPEEWISYIQPRLANDIDAKSLRRVYDKLISRDLNDPLMSLSAANPIKERVFTFKDAQSQLEYEERFGYKKLISAHLINNINALGDKIALRSVVGGEKPEKVIKFVGKLNGLTNAETKGILEEISHLRLQPASTALSKAVQIGLTTSRALNAIFKPGAIFLHMPADFLNAAIQAFGKYGISNTVKGMFNSAPSTDIKYLANLPFAQKEVWKNILGEFKQESRLAHLDIMGARIQDKTTPTLKLLQRAYLKLGGMHMLDNMVRKYALRIAAESLKQEYKVNRLANLLPKTNQEILAQALNSSGELVPSKLDEIADKLIDTNIAQDYRDVANKLKYLYAKSINDANPIYSPVLAKFNQYDPAIAAGSRSILWALRLYYATYGDMLKQLMFGKNRIFAGATIAATAYGLSAIETAIDHITNQITGNKTTETTGILILDSVLNNNIPQGFERDHAINLVKNLTLFSSIFSAPIWYGSGANALRAASYEMLGNDKMAAQDIKKAIPLLGMLTNLYANQTQQAAQEYQRKMLGMQ